MTVILLTGLTFESTGAMGLPQAGAGMFCW
jgi:hypothetical protein